MFAMLWWLELAAGVAFNLALCLLPDRGGTLAGMARDPRTPQCSIKGCSRAAHKGYLCRKHYAMVPPELSGGRLMVACMMAQLKVASQWRRRQLAAVRQLLAAGGA